MKNPRIAPSACVLPGAVMRGDISLGARSSVWYNAVLRGDAGTGVIRIGQETNIQDLCVLHAGAEFPVEIGDRVTVGHGCLLHGCRIGSGSLVGMGSIVMDGAVIGEGCLIGAGSLVVEGTVIPAGMLAFGRPAKVIRPLREEEKDANLAAAQEYVALAQAI